MLLNLDFCFVVCNTWTVLCLLLRELTSTLDSTSFLSYMLCVVERERGQWIEIKN